MSRRTTQWGLATARAPCSPPHILCRRTTQWGLATESFVRDLIVQISGRRTTQWGLATLSTTGSHCRSTSGSENYPMGIGDYNWFSVSEFIGFFVGELPNGDWRWLLTRANFNKLSKGDKEFSKICGKHESRIIKNLKLRSDSPCKISQSRR